VPGHQSVLVRLPKTGAILLTIDAVPFGEGFTRDEQDDASNPDAEAIRASTMKLLDLVEREHIGLVIFGHDQGQWETLKKAPEFYEYSSVSSEKVKGKAETNISCLYSPRFI
jgi:N-acyl homoserine lactone hydrolase